jgi:hypothetical protein
MAKKVGVGRAFLEALIDRGCSDNDFYKEQFRVLKENPKFSILRVALEGRLIAKAEIEVMRKFVGKLGIFSETFGSAIKNGANPSD